MTRTHAKSRGRALRVNRLLIEHRLDAGMTPNDLAKRAGISGNTVRAAERGEYVDPRSQRAIACALQATRVVLFPFERQREAA
ncbi:helix-turn-helix domain-containing protein [Paraconexibacter algicola]|nr:helix-turn-helix transcriptional regulator [Paraconexibacter algicola]